MKGGKDRPQRSPVGSPMSVAPRQESGTLSFFYCSSEYKDNGKTLGGRKRLALQGLRAI